MDFKLITLATSAAGPIPGRWAGGQYLKAARAGLLFDCGEGLQIALQRQGIGWSAIDLILISHMHGDHIYGLPGLLTSWALHQRNRPLTIIGPAGLRDYLEHTFRHSHTGLPYPVEYRVVDPVAAPALVYEDRHVKITTLPLDHRVPTTGYLVRERPRARTMRGAAIQTYGIPFAAIPTIKAGADYTTPDGTVIPNETLTAPAPPPRSFAYCSDTRYLPDLIPLLTGVDLLYHEATFLHELAEQATLTGHTTARQAAELARAAGVGRLILGHFSPRYGELTPLLNEARAVFPAADLAEEGRTFEVDYGERQVE